jgi:hypothetical protein
VHAEDDSALLNAAREGHAETVRALLTAGADVYAGDDRALPLAALNSHMEIVQALARHVFAPDTWRGRSRVEIEGYASALYGKIEASPITPEVLHKAGTILADYAIDCWHQVRPPPPPGFKISQTPAQPRPL